MPAFQWLTFAQAQTELSLRLGDPGQVRWTQAEVSTWIIEALRVFQCLTAYWDDTFHIPLKPPFTSNWFQANAAGSLRQQTLTDAYVYSLIQYHLLEPPTAPLWTGTNQFSIADLAQACSRRLNEILQTSACNMQETVEEITPGTDSVTLQDLILDVGRARFVPATGYGAPVTLQRGDSLSFQRYTPAYAQTSAFPLRWDVLGSPPQVVSLDTKVNVPSTLQTLCVMGVADFAPPAISPLFIPDDWNWVLKFGALFDILSKEQEGHDMERATYAKKRYIEGMTLMGKMPWLLQGYVNGVSVDTQAVAGADHFNYEWQSRATAFPEIVIGGIDLFAVTPILTAQADIALKVVINAPIPATQADPIEVPRDIMDSILDEAQHLALFGMGGAEFKQSIALHQSFIKTCTLLSRRLRESGIFASDLRPNDSREDEDQPRFAVEGKRQ